MYSYYTTITEWEVLLRLRFQDCRVQGQGRFSALDFWILSLGVRGLGAEISEVHI